MKCKKPNCNGVAENGICTKCGAESKAPAGNEENKKEKDSTVKEPGTASAKSSAEVQSKAVGNEKGKAVSTGKMEPADKAEGRDKAAPAKGQSSAKLSEDKDGQKETGRKEAGHQVAEQKHKDSEHKKESERKVEHKEVSHKELQEEAQTKKKDEPEPAKHEDSPKDVVPESASSASRGVTPPPLAGTQNEQKSEKPEQKPEPKPEQRVEPKAELKSDSSTSTEAQSGAPKPAEQAAKKSSTEERKKIESTIPNSVVPAATERPSLKDVNLEDTAAYRNIIVTVRSMLEPREVAPTREDLYHASRALRHVMPYNFDAWRLHADLLLTAIHQLETRQLQPDPNFTLMAIPLREDDLRDAAEQALRECAHFADNEKLEIELIDEANSIRRLTWF